MVLVEMEEKKEEKEEVAIVVVMVVMGEEEEVMEVVEKEEALPYSCSLSTNTDQSKSSCHEFTTGTDSRAGRSPVTQLAGTTLSGGPGSHNFRP